MIYECHITCYESDSVKCEEIARELHWKTSEIARDPVLGDKTFFYLTSHADNFPDIWNRMTDAVLRLQLENVPVLREKIELVIHDARMPFPKLKAV